MCQIATRYAGAIRTVFVYILEAHAVDEWHVRSINTELAQHRTLLDRHAAAMLFLERYPLCSHIELLLDNEDNGFNSTYSSWPFRYWIIDEKGFIAVKAMPVGDKLTLKPLEQWLCSKFPLL